MSRAAAWELEQLKLRRSPVARTAATVLVAGTTSMAAAFTAVGLGDGQSQMALKVRPMLHGDGWSAYLGLLGQVLSVATLLCVGVVLSWSVGREFVDGTIGSLLALPTPPGTILLAKVGAVVLGSAACACAAVVLAVPLGLLAGLGPPGDEALTAGLKALAVALLSAALTLPLAYVASARRGYLPGVGALLGVVVLTQVATLAGAGAWFPWATPGLWAGMGGEDAARAVAPAQLLLALPVAALGTAAAARWWSAAELR